MKLSRKECLTANNSYFVYDLFESDHEKLLPKLMLHVLSGYPNTEKETACGLVLSFVSRCLDTPIKHLLSFWK